MLGPTSTGLTKMVFRHAYVNGGSQVRRVLVLAQCISRVIEVWRLFDWLRGCIYASPANMSWRFWEECNWII